MPAVPIGTNWRQLWKYDRYKNRLLDMKYVILFLAAGNLLLSGAGATAMEATLEVAGGYDDNVARVPAGEGSAMARYLALLWLPVTGNADAPGLDLYLEGMYCQYFSLDDNQQLRVGTEVYTAPWKDRFRAGLFGEATLYRDSLVAEDEHNTLLAGGVLQWMVDARLTLSLQQTFSKVEYKNPVSLPGLRIYTVGKGKGRGTAGRETIGEGESTAVSQEDTVSVTEVMASYAMGPDFQTDLSFLYRDSNSSNDYESHQEIGGYAKITWFCTDFLDVFASGHFSTLDYETAPGGIARSDDAYGFGLGGNWWVGSAKLFANFDRTINDSPFSGEEFRKSVALCGVSFTF
jgi:hypothetical protein